MHPEIPGFKIIKSLGEGAMAKVYLALDEALDREVALKVMNASFAVDPEFRDRFINEAKDTAKFNHEGIVKIFTTGAHNNNYFLALEYLQAGTLKDNLNKRKNQQSPEDGAKVSLYGSDEALALLKSLAEALAYAHDKHVIHRDIKPENILFRADGHAVLSDFGIAKSVNENKNLTMAGLRVGTPAYMSPEQMLGAEVDTRSDLYSLGIVFYEILVGHRPYKTSSSEYSELIKQLDEPVPELPQKLNHLQPLLQAMLAKRPDKRAGSAHEIIGMINSISEATNPTYADRTVIQPIIRDKGSTGLQKAGEKRRIKWLLPLLVSSAIMGFIGFYVLSQPEKEPPIVVQPVDDETAALISELLDSAQTYLEFNFVISPPVSNAVENFNKVLALQPNNQKALVGLKKSESMLLEHIEKELNSNNLNTASSLIKLGLHFFPESKKLTELQKKQVHQN